MSENVVGTNKLVSGQKPCRQSPGIFQNMPVNAPWQPVWWRAVLSHDDVIKWKHFPRYWPFVREIHRSPVNFPHKGHWRGALMFTFICDRMNGLVNNREAGDSRRYLAHYDVIVMFGFTYEIDTSLFYNVLFVWKEYGMVVIVVTIYGILECLDPVSLKR